MEPFPILQQALSAHHSSDFKAAYNLYFKLLQNSNLFGQLSLKNQEACLLNYSSLTRKLEKQHEAIKFLVSYLSTETAYSVEFARLLTTTLAIIIWILSNIVMPRSILESACILTQFLLMLVYRLQNVWDFSSIPIWRTKSLRTVFYCLTDHVNLCDLFSQ